MDQKDSKILGNFDNNNIALEFVLCLSYFSIYMYTIAVTIEQALVVVTDFPKCLEKNQVSQVSEVFIPFF